MKLNVLIFFLTSMIFSAWSADDHHLISLGTSGFGLSGAAEKINPSSDSSFDAVQVLVKQISLNYAFRFMDRLQIGGFYQNDHNDYKFKSRKNRSSSSYTNNQIYGIFFLFNFSKKINDTFFIGLSTSFYNMEEENSKDFTDAESKQPFELDDEGFSHELVLGKRFSLRRWNIDHLTFAPQLGIFYRGHGKDFSDQKITEGFGVSVQTLKFDFLF
jgi:hypothetical protein